jgi:hypothetical protein
MLSVADSGSPLLNAKASPGAAQGKLVHALAARRF